MIKCLCMLRMLRVLRICGHLSDGFQEFWPFLTASVSLTILRAPTQQQLQMHTKNVCSGLISFRIDWFDLLAVQGTPSSPIPQAKNISFSVLNFLYGPTLTSIQDYWKNHSSD